MGAKKAPTCFSPMRAGKKSAPHKKGKTQAGQMGMKKGNSRHGPIMLLAPVLDLFRNDTADPAGRSRFRRALAPKALTNCTYNHDGAAGVWPIIRVHCTGARALAMGFAHGLFRIKGLEPVLGTTLKHRHGASCMEPTVQCSAARRSRADRAKSQNPRFFLA